MKRANQESQRRGRKKKVVPDLPQLAGSSSASKLAWNYVPESIQESVMNDLLDTANTVLEDCTSRKVEKEFRQVLAKLFEHVGDKLDHTPVPPDTTQLLFTGDLESEIEKTEEALIPVLSQIGLLETEINKTET